MSKIIEATVEVEAAVEFNKDEYLAKMGNKSKAIRALLAEGKTRSQVAKMLDIRYQHVRNVEITPIKKVGEVTTGETK